MKRSLMKKSNISTDRVSLEISIVLVVVAGCNFLVFAGFSPDEIILYGLQEVVVSRQVLLRAYISLVQQPGRCNPLLEVRVIEVCAVPPHGGWFDCSAGPEDVLGTLRVVATERVPLAGVAIPAITDLVADSSVLFAAAFGALGCLFRGFGGAGVAVEVAVFGLLIKFLFDRLPEFAVL
jgi:hypothetical protein